jgi:beta-glucosidase
MADIDRAVRRILRQKFRLGLFERPYVDVDQAVNGVPRDQHRELALQAAREGIVLLKNEGNLLPLDKNVRRIAVIGPNADHGRNLLGDYTSKTILQHIVTVLEGIKVKVSRQTEVVYVKGCNVIGSAVDEIAQAREAARNADVAVVVVGENERRAPPTSI